MSQSPFLWSFFWTLHVLIQVALIVRVLLRPHLEPASRIACSSSCRPSLALLKLMRASSSGGIEHLPLPEGMAHHMPARGLELFGGGTLHYCGNGRHQLENYLATPGLVGLNIWCMGEFEQVFEAQRIVGERAAIMVCDYTPTDLERYFGDLFSGLDPRGAIVATYPSAVTAL